MWKNVEDPDRTQITTSPMPIAFWITKATDEHSQYVTLTAFPL
jgi:hypothetical protein